MTVMSEISTVCPAAVSVASRRVAAALRVRELEAGRA